MLQHIDRLSEDYWHLVLVALVMLLGWRVVARLGGRSTLREHFPRFVAYLDLLFLPSLFFVGGSLLRMANKVLGIPVIDPRRFCSPIWRLAGRWPA